MTLFTALSDKDPNKSGSTTTSNSSSSCSPPQAIQLHGSKFINFLSGTTIDLDNNATATTNNNNDDTTYLNNNRHFSVLSYQAVQTQRDDDVDNKQQHVRPDLGIWDCRVSGTATTTSADDTAMLLQRVVVNHKNNNSTEKTMMNEEKKETDDDHDNQVSAISSFQQSQPTVVVLTVDTNNPESVQPSMEQMRSVILSTMANNTNNNPAVSNKNTTSMKVLQSSPFGITKITESVTTIGSNNNNQDSESSSLRVAIIIAAIVSSSSTAADDTTNSKSAADEYKERQAKSLVLYHLHKFALECDCTLCFVSEHDAGSSGGEEGKTDDSGGVSGNNDDGEKNDVLGNSMSSLTIDELGRVIRRVALGLSPVVEEDLNAAENEIDGGESKTDNNVASSSGISSIHAPGSHDAELIHGAFLRNASCEGEWDASKDDLIVALPPRSSSSHDAKETEASKEGTTSNVDGDEEWLSKLAASVGLTPEAVSSQGGDAAAASTTPAGKKSPKRERPVVKKRTTRSGASKSKDGKPKDQKEVMNFFDDLLKK